MAYIKHHTSVSVTIGNRNLGIWQTKEGEEIEVESKRIFPGGGLPQINLGGVRTVADVTVGKVYDDELRGLRLWLQSQAGSASMAISTQQLDADGNPYGTPATVVGKVGNIKFPDAEAGSSDEQIIEI